MSPMKTKRSSEESLNSASSHEEETQSVMSFILSKGQAAEPIQAPPLPPELPAETPKRRLCYTSLKRYFRPSAKVINLALMHAFFIWLMVRDKGARSKDTFCSPIGLLAMVIRWLDLRILYMVSLRCGPRKTVASITGYVIQKAQVAGNNKLFTRVFWTIVYSCLTILLLVDTWGYWSRLISAGGLIVMLFFGYIFSIDRSKVRWNVVLSGVLLQIMLGIFILRIEYGKTIVECLSSVVTSIMQFSNSGSDFVFGYLSTGRLAGNLPPQPPIFAFRVIPNIFFFGMLVSVLYFFNILQYVVLRFSWIMNVLVGTSGVESFCAAANIFVGMAEAPILVKPYLPSLTKSEIHCIMTAGMATIAGSLFAVYISLGVRAEHLLAASVMSAPAALAFSKLFYPETSDLGVRSVTPYHSTEHNVLEAMVNGMVSMVGIASAIITCLVGFVALMALGDSALMKFGEVLGWKFITVNWVIGRLFMPLALIMGVSVAECSRVASLVSTKTVLNEFIAFRQMTDDINAGLLSVRAELISTYALCGFSNMGSLGIQLGAFSAMMPTRLRDCAAVASRAFISGSVACFMTACVAGALADTSAYERPMKFNSTNYI